MITPIYFFFQTNDYIRILIVLDDDNDGVGGDTGLVPCDLTRSPSPWQRPKSLSPRF